MQEKPGKVLLEGVMRIDHITAFTAQVVDKRTLAAKRILSPCSGVVVPGELCALVGPSGAGAPLLYRARPLSADAGYGRAGHCKLLAWNRTVRPAHYSGGIIRALRCTGACTRYHDNAAEGNGLNLEMGIAGSEFLQEIASVTTFNHCHDATGMLMRPGSLTQEHMYICCGAHSHDLFTIACKPAGRSGQASPRCWTSWRSARAAP